MSRITEKLYLAISQPKRTCYPQQFSKAQKLGRLFVARGGLANTLLDEAETVRAQSHCRIETSFKCLVINPGTVSVFEIEPKVPIREERSLINKQC